MQYYKHHYFPNIPEHLWNDYHWQYRHSIRTAAELKTKIQIRDDEDQFFEQQTKQLSFLITPYYLSLMNPEDKDDPIRKTVIPRSDELEIHEDELSDPLGEEGLSPVPGLVHRYPDRVLFLVTAFCSTYCRYCTRSRMVGNFQEYKFPKSQWDRAINYIKQNKQIKDVLLSGGDPLTLPNEALDYLLQKLSDIEHLSLIRIGTKIPIVLPQRIDKNLVETLTRYKPIWLSLHFTHPSELQVATKDACQILANAGIPMMSQTVLLKGVNDRTNTLKELFYGLIECRVKPYYLLHCDLVKGSKHFRTKIEDDLNILKELHGHVSGYAMPKYVIDLPNGKGKVSPSQIDIQNIDQKYYVKNYRNELIELADYH